MNTKCLEKLEYNTILKNISEYATTYLGKEAVLSLHPYTKKEEVLKLLNETMEATTLIYRKGNLPLSPIANNEFSIKAIESGSSLSIASLLDLNQILKLGRELKSYYSSEEIDLDTSFIQYLEYYFSSLYSNLNIEKEISKAIIDDSTISDDASPTLKDIRRKKRKMEESIKDKLHNFIHSSANSKFIQESIVTIKNGRYVVPIKQEYRSSVKGFIHDISSSGSTVFMEPTSVFDLNNEMNSLILDESIEIEKILMKLSSLFFPISEEIKKNIEIIVSLDIIFAKAKYSIFIDGILPNINEEKKIVLNKARHPLIEKEKVVPVDIHIGTDFTALVITGPNTGGKTVCIKTVGLLMLMAYTGILIPASDNSSIHIFNTVFCDIGDEQSITESVSTFSSHILNIVEISKNVTENSLVILDELGSGTDPIEGSSLAISILEYFYKKNCLVIATTHYKEVKDFTMVTPGFYNASFEFDLENIKPTYKLLMGIPGKSNAFEISKKLGLESSILDNAKQYLKKDTINMEDLLKKIYDDKIIIESEKESILKKSSELEKLKELLEKQKEDYLEKEKNILDKAKLEARNLLLSAKEKLKKIEEELKSAEEIREKKQHLNEDIKLLSSNISNYTIKASSSPCFKKEDIQIGMNVYIPNFNKNGTILSLPNKNDEVNVQIGNMKINLNINTLEKEKNSSNINNLSKGNVKTNLSKSKQITNEINVIGLNVDEAIPIVDKYLDDVAVSSLSSVRIVHGKGTGALRKGIQAFLKNHPHVKNYRLGTFGEGEMGVTVVELK